MTDIQIEIIIQTLKAIASEKQGKLALIAVAGGYMRISSVETEVQSDFADDDWAAFAARAALHAVGETW